jgi:hypothetical protein
MLPDPTRAAEDAARATYQQISPGLDEQSVQHYAAQAAASWLTEQGVSREQFDCAAEQDPIKVAYQQFVRLFHQEYARLRSDRRDG